MSPLRVSVASLVVLLATAAPGTTPALSQVAPGTAAAPAGEATPSSRGEPRPPPEPSVPQTVERTRVGVVLLPRGAASPEIADSLTELLIAAVASRGAMEIVGKEEFQAALGRDDAGTLACIESDACLGRMGRELGVRELVAGTIHVAEGSLDRFRFELYRLDVESGGARGRVAREIEGGLSALLAALTSSVDELYVERIVPGAIVVTTSPGAAVVALDHQPLEQRGDGTFRADFVVPGEHTLSGRAPGFQPFERPVLVDAGTTLMLSVELSPRAGDVSISPLTWSTAGAGLALGLAAIGLGVGSQWSPEGELDMRQSQAFYDARATEATAANVLFAGSGVALIAGVVSLVLDLAGDPDSRVVARLLRGEVATW